MEKSKPRVILVGGLPRPSGGVTVFLGRLVRALGDQIDFHILDINVGEKEPNKATTHRVMPTQRLLRVIMIAVYSVILPADIIHYHYSRPPPCVRVVVRCSIFLYFSGGRDRTMTWDIHRIGMDHNADRGRCKNIHGRARAIFGQHLHRTPLAVIETGGSVFARVNRWFCGRTCHS